MCATAFREDYLRWSKPLGPYAALLWGVFLYGPACGEAAKAHQAGVGALD